MQSAGPFERGVTLLEQGDLEAAADEWAFAAMSTDRDVAIRAITSYGRLIGETEFRTDTTVGRHRVAKSIRGQGVADADRLWRMAAESDHPDAAWALVGLGRLYDPTDLADQPDPERGEQAYARAAESGHPDASPYALLKLGRLREELGRGGEGQVRAAAIDALERGSESGHAEWAPRCANQLARLYSNAGDVERAEHWYAVVARSGHPDLAPLAAGSLGEHVPLEEEADMAFELRCDDAETLDRFDRAIAQLRWQGEVLSAGSYDFRRGELGPHRLRCLTRGGLLAKPTSIEVLVKQTDRGTTSVGLVGGDSRDQNRLRRALGA